MSFISINGLCQIPMYYTSKLEYVSYTVESSCIYHMFKVKTYYMKTMKLGDMPSFLPYLKAFIRAYEDVACAT